MADDQQVSTSQKALIGAGLAVAVGAAGFLLARRSADVHDDGTDISDAPDYMFRRKTGRYQEGLVGRTVTVNLAREVLYGVWRDFRRFPTFMENVEEIEDLGGGRSKVVLKTEFAAPRNASSEQQRELA